MKRDYRVWLEVDGFLEDVFVKGVEHCCDAEDRAVRKVEDEPGRGLPQIKVEAVMPVSEWEA